MSRLQFSSVHSLQKTCSFESILRPSSLLLENKISIKSTLDESQRMCSTSDKDMWRSDFSASGKLHHMMFSQNQESPSEEVAEIFDHNSGSFPVQQPIKLTEGRVCSPLFLSKVDLQQHVPQWNSKESSQSREPSPAVSSKCNVNLSYSSFFK